MTGAPRAARKVGPGATPAARARPARARVEMAYARSRKACDGVDLGGASCASVVDSTSVGALACTPQCTLDASGCSEPAVCGDGMVTGNEQCDGADLAGHSCADVGGANGLGKLACSPTCTFDTSVCHGPVCGNGVIDPNETCDLGGVTPVGCAHCDVTCQVACCSGEVQVGTHCYGSLPTATDWAGAEAACKAQPNAHLVSVTTSNEFIAVGQLVDVVNDAEWIGLHDATGGGTFAWSDGETLAATFWDTTEPSGGTCVKAVYYLIGQSGYWDATPCTEVRYPVCEYEPVGMP